MERKDIIIKEYMEVFTDVFKALCAMEDENTVYPLQGEWRFSSMFIIQCQ